MFNKLIKSVLVFLGLLKISTFEVSYIFLSTDAPNEVGRIKGWDKLRNIEVVTKPYTNPTVKFGDKVEYYYKSNQIKQLM